VWLFWNAELKWVKMVVNDSEAPMLPLVVTKHATISAKWYEIEKTLLQTTYRMSYSVFSGNISNDLK